MKEYKYKINGNSYKVTIGDIEDNIAHVEVNGTHYKVEMEKQPKPAAKPVTVRPMPNAPTAPTQVVKPTAPSTGKSGVKSPLPGVILDIKVNVGDTVKKGQTIIILEAMKMENEIMLVNERYNMLEEVSDDIVLDYDVKKQQFEIPECYLKFAEDKSVKYAGIEELYGACLLYTSPSPRD